MAERDFTETILAENVSRDDFMAGYDGLRVEWIEGTVIEMPSIGKRHNQLTAFLITFFNTYLDITQSGELYHDPMLIRLDKVSRAPDITILLDAKAYLAETNEIAGVPDFVLEVVSPSTQRIDRHIKFQEYERNGIAEYWIIDPIFNEALFYVLDTGSKQYVRQQPDASSIYHSVVLQNLQLKVDVLWQPVLPGVLQTVAMVQAMLPHDTDTA